MYVGLTIVFGLAAIAFLPMHLLSDAAAIAALVSAVGAIAATPGMIKQRREARYDLAALRKVQDREELRQIELDESAEFDSVHCLNCGEIYNSRLPICPRCRASQGAR